MRRLVVLAALATLAAVAVVALPDSSRASGCTITWVGDVDGNWFGGVSGDNTNWDDNTFPDASDHVCLNTLGAPYTVTLSADAPVNHYSIQSGATLAIGGVFPATLRATADSTNAGTINLNSGNATLQTENGTAGDVETLTNTGTINVPAGGSDGARIINGDLLNQGTISVAHPSAQFQQAAENRNSKLTNTGTLTVASGGALLMLDSALLQSGTIDGQGTINLGAGAFADTGGRRLKLAGGQITSPVDVNVTANSTLEGVAGSTATGNVDIPGPSEAFLSGTVPAGITVDIGGASTATLRATADSTNAGTINLNGGDSRLQIENGTAGDVETLTNTNTGTINVPAGGTGGARSINGDVANQGTISVARPETAFQQAAENRNSKLTNTGTLTIASGGVLLMLDSALLQNAGGTINGEGTINIGAGAFADTGGRRLKLSGGQITSPVDVNVTANSTLEGVAGSTATGNVDIPGGNSFLSGTVPAGITVDIDGATGVAATLRATADATNAGTINLNGPNAALVAANGDPGDVETLTNTGTINVPADATAGNRQIGADLVNQGTISVAHPDVDFRQIVESRNPRLTNTGTLTVASGGQLRMLDSTLLQGTGGTINGAGIVNLVCCAFGGSVESRLQVSGGQIAASADVNLGGATTLAFVSATAATGNVDVLSTTTVSGDVPAGFSIDLDASNSILRSLASYTHAGTINLLGSGSQLRTDDGNPGVETLTNTGTITSGAGTRSIVGGLINAGIVAPGGDGIGTLNADSYTQTAAGRLEIGVASSSSADRLAASGAAALDGTLALSRTGPALTLGQTFDVVTHGSRTGTFSTLVGASSGPFAVRYEPGSVRLEVVEAGPNPEVSVGEARVREGEAGTTEMTVPVTLNRDAATPVRVRATTRNALASAPGDYVARTETLTIPAGARSVPFTVTVNGDEVPENDETFRVELSSPEGADLGRDRATATIDTDDPALSSVSPRQPGAGPVTLTLGGLGLVPGSNVRLRRSGQADVAATEVTSAPDQQRIEASFDLSGRPLGRWEVDVTLPDGRGTATLPGGVELTAPGQATPWVEVSGPRASRFGRSTQFQLVYGNSGNVDAVGVRISLTGIPARSGAPVDLVGKGEFVSSRSGDGMELYLKRIPAGGSAPVRFAFTQQTEAPTTVTAVLRQSVFDPATAPPTDPSVRRLGAVEELSGTRLTGRVNALQGGTDLGPLRFSLQASKAPEDASEFAYTDRSAGDQTAFTARASYTTALLDGVPPPPREAAQTREPDESFTLDFDAGSAQKILDALKTGKDALDKGNDLIADYSIELDRLTINNCLLGLGLITEGSKKSLDDLAKAGFTIKLVNAAIGDAAGEYHGQHLKLLTQVTAGAWEKKLLGFGELTPSVLDSDNQTNPNNPFLGGTDQEQLAMVLALCLSRPDVSGPPRFIPPPGSTRTTQWQRAADPNDKVGPEGDGSAQHQVMPGQPLRYQVRFENKPEATAPAAEVVVTDQLDPAKVDLDTFALGPITFGDRIVTPPAGLQNYTTTVDLGPARPILVKINAGLDRTSNRVTWRLTAIDPVTGEQPIDPALGFLPPNATPPAGEGGVSFTVDPKAGLATGTAIENAASIVFDVNAPINTGTWLNTIDRDAPVAAARDASPVPGPNCATDLRVNWAGTDQGSGIRRYDLYMAEGSAPLALMLPNTMRTETVFRGRAGATYRFAVRAVDGAGNLQAVPATAQAQGTPGCPSAPPPGPGPKAVPLLDRLAPTVTAKLTNARFRLGPGRTPIIAAKKRKRAPVGTTFRITLSEPAAYTIRISRVTTGVKKGKKCVKPSKKTKKGKKPKKCTLLTTAGTLTRRAGKQGRNDVKFSGRIASKALARGSYRAEIAAADAAGNRSKPKTLPFTIVK